MSANKSDPESLNNPTASAVRVLRKGSVFINYSEHCCRKENPCVPPPPSPTRASHHPPPSVARTPLEMDAAFALSQPTWLSRARRDDFSQVL